MSVQWLAHHAADLPSIPWTIRGTRFGTAYSAHRLSQGSRDVNAAFVRQLARQNPPKWLYAPLPSCDSMARTDPARKIPRRASEIRAGARGLLAASTSTASASRQKRNDRTTKQTSGTTEGTAAVRVQCTTDRMKFHGQGTACRHPRISPAPPPIGTGIR